MSHWIFEADEGGYVGTRKVANHRHPYEARTSLEVSVSLKCL